MSRKPTLLRVLFCVIALVVLPAVVPAQQETELLEVALPNETTVIVGESLVLITGRPTSAFPVNCAAGTPQPFGGVVVDEGGGYPAQRTSGLVFQDTEPRPGTRIRIVGGPAICNGDLLLWQGVAE